MFDFLGKVITFLPWLITKLVVFGWAICTSIVGFIFGIIIWPFKAIFGLIMSVLLFVLPGTATATTPPPHLTDTVSTPQVAISYNL